MPQNIEQGEPLATQFFLLEDIEPSEPFATEAHFPLLEDIEPSELFAREAHFPLETELFDLMDEFFNTISSCPKKKRLPFH